jgi:DNA-binding NtrC family response regulator
MMERAVLLCTGDEILPEHLLLESMSAAMAPAADPLPDISKQTTAPMGMAAPVLPAAPGAAADPDAERDRILRVLAECGGNQSRAAKMLGIARSTLVLRLNEYQVPRPRK